MLRHMLAQSGCVTMNHHLSSKLRWVILLNLTSEVVGCGHDGERVLLEFA